MHGNVWEWCEDIWHKSYEDKPKDLNASGGAWTTGGSDSRVLRGGSWFGNPVGLRAARRFRFDSELRSNYLGFRVARTF